jgi:hypothetical protein
MIYVTHDQVEAMTLGDRIALLKGGRLQQVGAPLELYQRQANAFVAGFIGTPPMNLLPAVVGNGRGTLEGPGFSLPVPSGWQPWAREAVGRRVLVRHPARALAAGGTRGARTGGAAADGARHRRDAGAPVDRARARPRGASRRHPRAHRRAGAGERHGAAGAARRAPRLRRRELRETARTSGR